jgi:CheY-like chemotaxis protein
VYQALGEILRGKRFALMGFETAEAQAIALTLAETSAFGHVIGGPSSVPRLNSFAPFDACIVNASAPAIGADRPSPVDLVAATSKPAIIIGTADELLKHYMGMVDLKRDFAIRPYQPGELLLKAYRILKSVDNATETMLRPARNGTRRMAVLADDDAVTIVMISTILKHFDFDCQVAHDGAAAISMVRDKMPDVVLLDVSMPQMNGFEALTALRSDPATREIPVVMVTAHHNEAELVKGFSLGADDYVTKPFNSGELMARIDRVLRVAG